MVIRGLLLASRHTFLCNDRGFFYMEPFKAAVREGRPEGLAPEGTHLDQFLL